ncbi:MAG: histidine phosphatase family protein [bacterium]|nr:histidine phosphatase family protein [bacterium]
MKTIYFVRHGESEENVGFHTGEGVFQGETSPLTERGREQARFIAERCAHLQFDALVASPAVRTQDTAGYISELTGKSIETAPMFTERILPEEFIGRKKDDPEIQERYNEWEASFFDENLRVGSGENFVDLKTRVAGALKYLTEHKADRIVVVTHGYFLRMLVAYIVFGDALTTEEFKKIIQTFRTANTGLTLAEYDSGQRGAVGLPAPQWLVRVWNDHAHLG